MKEEATLLIAVPEKASRIDNLAVTPPHAIGFGSFMPAG